MGNRLTSIFEALGGDLENPGEVLHLANSKEKQDLIRALLAERNRQGLTQKQLGSRMGITQEAVCRFEGLGGDPRISTLMRYATALGLRVEFKTTPASDPIATRASIPVLLEDSKLLEFAASIDRPVRERAHSRHIDAELYIEATQ